MNGKRLLPCQDPMPPIAGCRVLVVGAGKCGVAASRLLIDAGAQVVLSDLKKRSELGSEVIALERMGVELELGSHTLRPNTRLIVRSPGVPRHLDVFEQAGKTKTPIVSEIELGAWFCAPPMIAVTGTDGKSSVVTMINLALQAAGFRSVEAGNIGTPLCEVVREDCARKLDYVVVEVSSYALENVHHFHPRVGVILNIAEDHLDHYKSLGEYADTKGRLAEKQDRKDYLILNAMDVRCVSFACRSRGTVRFFSIDPHESDGAFFSGDKLVYRTGEQEFIIPVNLDNWFLHQKENFLAAFLSAVSCGGDMKIVAEALSRFKGLPHRIEFVREFNGVRFYNDSKATTPHATSAALKTMNSPVILIAGGDSKGTDLSSLRPLIAEKVKRIIALGMSRDQFVQTFGDLVSCEIADTLNDAVLSAARLAHPGEIVLLSPACSSLDMFKNFEERGRVFAEAVERL